MCPAKQWEGQLSTVLQDRAVDMCSKGDRMAGSAMEGFSSSATGFPADQAVGWESGSQGQ